MGVQLGFMGVQLGGKGHRGRFTGLRLRCGDWRAAAGGCHCASLIIKRRAAAAAVRPCVRPGPGPLPSSFPQVTCLGRSGRPVLPPLFACEMRARPALAVLAWGGDGSPVWGCITTSGDQVPPRTPTKTGAISPNQTPLEHAPGGRPSRPPRPPAAQPPPVREAAITGPPVAPVIPGASPGRRRQGNSGARRPMPLASPPAAGRMWCTGSAGSTPLAGSLTG